MNTAIKYVLSIFVIFFALNWCFNHVSAWGSIIAGVVIIVWFLKAKSTKIKEWFDDNL